MEEIEVGDVVRLKGDQNGKVKFIATPSTTYVYGNDKQTLSKHGLVFVNEVTNSVETCTAIPDVCMTKVPMNKITYVKDEERTPESIMVGDVVSLKTNPEIKMVVHDLSVSGQEINAIYYNPIKGDMCRTSALPRECFIVYEIIIRE